MNIGFGETVAIVAVALLIFGPNKLPELARSIGKGIREFKHALAFNDDGASRPKPEQQDDNE